MRSLLDEIFVDTDADTRLSRRIRRDISSVVEISKEFSHGMKDLSSHPLAYCFPQRNYADVILPRGAENSVAIAMIVENLRTVLVEYDCQYSTLLVTTQAERDQLKLCWGCE